MRTSTDRSRVPWNRRSSFLSQTGHPTCARKKITARPERYRRGAWSQLHVAQVAHTHNRYSQNDSSSPKRCANSTGEKPVMRFAVRLG